MDRCFTLRGAGTVVTGTLWSGNVQEGQEIRIEPAGRSARVRAVHVHDERVALRERRYPRVALNLAGVERGDVRRGDVIVTGEGPHARPTLGHRGGAAAGREAAAAGRARACAPRHAGHRGAREPLEAEELSPGRPGLAQLRLEQPLVAAAGDRFVLRRIAPPGTLGGGRVLDAHARKHGPSEAHVRPVACSGKRRPFGCAAHGARLRRVGRRPRGE